MNQDPFPPRTIDVLLPDLESGDDPVRFVTWLVAEGARVIPGERIAELLTQGIVWQLEATASGILTQLSAQPGRVVSSGELLARITVQDDSTSDTD